MAVDGFAGMGALITQLEQLPDRLRDETEGIVQATADLMAADLRREYPEHEGALRRGVVVERSAGSEAKVKVRSKAPHAHLYEYGTVQRFLAGNGANRGTMPARPTFIPIAQRNRRRMVEQLMRIVKNTRVHGMDGSMELRET